MRRFSRLGLLLALVAAGWLLGERARAQDPAYQLSVTNSAGVSGTVDLRVLFDNGGDQVAGWSYAVCHGPEVDIVDAVMGATSLTVKSGALPDFESTVLYPGQGWTTGLVIDFFSAIHLPPGSGYELNVATYSLLGVPGDIAEVCFCPDVLGDPIPVSVVITIQGGISVTPTTTCGQIEILDQTFHYTLPETTVGLAAGGTASFTAVATIAEDEGNNGYPNDVWAFSMSVASDPTYLAPTAAATAGVLAGLGLGAGPDYFATSVYPDGITIGAVFAYEMDSPLTFATAADVVSIDYDVNAPSVTTDPVNTTLLFAPLGDPQVENVVVKASLEEISTVGHGGVITLLPPGFGNAFVRGDSNSDGLINIADPVYNLAYQFTSGPSFCLKAMDCNDDGAVDISDPVYNLSFQFVAGPPIPPPAVCGFDTTDDTLTCDSFPACP